MSRLLRVRCYLLASQGHVLDFTKHTERVVPPDVSRSINENGITFPDVQCLCNGIETLTMNVAPFPEINAFRQRCFSSFAINQRRGLTLTQVGLSCSLCYFVVYSITPTCRYSTSTWPLTKSATSGSSAGSASTPS
jgi:hypothetical protein